MIHPEIYAVVVLAILIAITVGVKILDRRTHGATVVKSSFQSSRRII